MRALALAATLLLAAPAFAQDEGAIPPEVLALFPQGTESCYAAHVDKGALKPGQTLTDFYLYRLFDPNPKTEDVAFSRDEAIAFDKRSGNGSWTAVMAKFTGQPLPYNQVVTCSVWDSIPGKVTCGVECDGGYFALVQKGDDAELTFPNDSVGLALNSSCGEPSYDDIPDRWMKAEEVQTPLQVKKADIAACVAAEAQVRAAYQGDPVSLRERIDTKGWRCLKRVYGKAHMDKHPDQTVTAMAVSIKGPAVTERVDDSYNYTHLDVSVIFKQGGGRIHRGNATCGAADYEFGCVGGFRLRRRDDSSAYLLAGEYDGEDGGAPLMLDTQLGRDDTIFRLDASTGADCGLD